MPDCLLDGASELNDLRGLLSTRENRKGKIDKNEMTTLLTGDGNLTGNYTLNATCLRGPVDVINEEVVVA